MRQRRDRLGDVPVRWLLEIEQHWKVVPLPKLVPDGVEYGLAVWREAAKDEDDLGRYGVDDVADLLVVQQQVDELGDFEAIHGNGRFICRCNDQISLNCAIQVHIPRSDSIDTTTRKIRIPKVSAHEDRVFNLVNATEVETTEIRTSEIRPIKDSALDVGSSKISVLEVGIVKRCTAEVRSTKVGFRAIAFAQRCE